MTPSLEPTRAIKSSGAIPYAAAASTIDSWPLVVGAKPPHVKPIFFLIISTNSSLRLGRNLPVDERPSTKDLLPRFSANKASPKAVSTGAPKVVPDWRPSNPIPVISLLVL